MSMWREIAGEGARLKREQLHREIGRLKDPTERANLEHTYSKLFMFFEEDLERTRIVSSNDREPVQAVKDAYAMLKEEGVKYGNGTTVYGVHGKMLSELLDYIQRLRGVIREANTRLRPPDSGATGVTAMIADESGKP